MPVIVAGQLFWQSESALHFGTQTPPPPVVAVVVPAAVVDAVPPLPPAPVVALVSSSPEVVESAAEPPLPAPEPELKSVVSVPLAQAAMRPPVARTRRVTLRLAYFTGL